MNRDSSIARLAADAPWDVLVIGGGATGLGCALDAASRGLKTALVERGDFAHGTSSRSTKLAHGGVRYLRAGQFSLVAQSLTERERLRRNAAGLVRDGAFLVPAYRFHERAWYGLGLALYGILAPGGGETRVLSRAAAATRVPGLKTDGLRGGVLYHDGQFDDARLALSLASTATRLGATVANYARADALLKHAGRVRGATVTDLETNRTFDVTARTVINAAGTGADVIRRMDDADARAMITTSRGTHIVLDAAFSPGETAIMIPRTDDGRVLFVIPWRGRLLVGTTDVPVAHAEDEPSAAPDDIDYLLAHASRYLTRAPARADIKSAFAGLRPLLAGSGRTASLSRDHRVVVSPGGLVTITGGKWTTFRHMAEDAVTRACRGAGIDARPSRTGRLKIDDNPWGVTADPLEIGAMTGEVSEAAADAFVRDAARNDMARTISDVLARRSRALFLDARGARALAPRVAATLARELGRDDAWRREQIACFEKESDAYRVTDQ
jgi:glycerol-3-phosphate dehydrogenase